MEPDGIQFKYKHILVVHGIGDQHPNETALGFMNEFIRALPKDDEKKLDVYNLVESVDGLKNDKKAATDHQRKFQPAYIVYSDPKVVNIIGFSEVYWQPIAEKYIDNNNGDLPIPIFVWGHSIATRLLDSNYALAQWRAAIDNLEVILKVSSRLAALSRRSEAFAKITTKFLGDVQMYAESDQIRQEINKKFFSVAARVDQFADQTKRGIRSRIQQNDSLLGRLKDFTDFGDPEIYVVAHSEGTVVAYNSLVQARMVGEGAVLHGGDREFQEANSALDQAAQPDGDATWPNKVRGLVTLGSPLDKHYIIWRSRFRKDRLKQDYASDAKIPWLNFFDYNDPVAYSLEELQGLKETGTQANVSAPRCTDARKLFAITDIGFQRYPIPGKAHVDYWTDAGIQHQIIRLMGLTGEKPQPGQPSNVPWVMALRPLLIWGGYPVLRLLTFLAGLFFLNGLLRVFGNNPLGLQGPYESLVSGPFTSLESWNIVFWLLVPVLVMKVLVYAEFGRFFGVPWTRWIRWILAAAWVVLAVIICGGGRFGVAESGFLDFAGNLTGILGTVLFWKLHTAIHRGLVQLWYYTAEVL